MEFVIFFFAFFFDQYEVSRSEYMTQNQNIAQFRGLMTRSSPSTQNKIPFDEKRAHRKIFSLHSNAEHELKIAIVFFSSASRKLSKVLKKLLSH